jgi:hypothetical protein
MEQASKTHKRGYQSNILTYWLKSVILHQRNAAPAQKKLQLQEDSKSLINQTTNQKLLNHQ